MKTTRTLTCCLGLALLTPWAQAADPDPRVGNAASALRELFQAEPWRLEEVRARLERAAEGRRRPPRGAVPPESTVSGRWLIYKKLSPMEAGYFETYWNFTPLFGPLSFVQTDRVEFGFGIDDLLPLPVPTIAFLVRNDQLGDCAPVYFGFKPPQPATQISGVLFCTNGSGTSGDWAGCSNPVPEVTWPGMLGATCTGLPMCPYTDPNCS